MQEQRTKNSYQKSIYDFINIIYVVCPTCSKQAIVKSPEYSAGKMNEQEIKLICTNCGHNKRLEEKPDSILHASVYKIITGKYLVVGGAIDPYFHLPLWLSVACCDNILWAYNYEHLGFLETHVASRLRERNTQEMANKSLGSRLPKWMRHRERTGMLS